MTTIEAFDAYWIRRGWAKDGPIKTQSRIDVPRRGKAIAAGRVAVAGVAWGGNRDVSAVEVRMRSRTSNHDGGWQAARLSDALSTSTWRQWVIEWDAKAGDYEIAVRATDGRGETQAATVQPPAPNGATGYHRINLQVRN